MLQKYDSYLKIPLKFVFKNIGNLETLTLRFLLYLLVV